MALSCTIRGTSVQVLTVLPFPNWNDPLETRSVLKLTIVDYTGLAQYWRGDPIVLSDGGTTLYSGYVQSDNPSKQSPYALDTTILHAITTMDHQYGYDKRTNNVAYTNWYAGDIALDLAQRIGASEGVTVPGALHRDNTQSSFAQGNLSGAVATSTGDLELAKAGSTVTITENTTAEFAAGTLTNAQATSNTLTPTTQSAISFYSNLPISLGDDSLYLQFWSGSQTVGTLDTLNYDIWISSTSPAFQVGIDLIFNDGTTLHSYAGPVDQNYLAAAITTDLSGYAKDTWYTRNISLTSALNGKTITGVVIANEGDAAGVYQAYVKNVYLSSARGSPFFSTSATTTNVNPPTVYSSAGYISTLAIVSVVQVLSGAASRISGAYSISAASLVGTSIINWTSSNANGSGVQVSVSYDGITFLGCTNGQPLPGLPGGAAVSGLSLYLQEILYVGTNPTTLPVLTNVTITITSGVAATKTDITTNYGNATAWNAGTIIGLTPNANGDLTLGTYTRNWTDNLITNQTFYPSLSGSPTQAATGGQYQITAPISGTLGYFGLSRFDFAGDLTNFVAEWDMSTSNTNGQVGVAFRTVGWTAYDLNFGYYFGTNGSVGIQLGYGSNSAGATSTGSYTQLVAHSTTISANTTYHVKLVCQGSHIQIFWNNSGTATIDVTNTQITGAGNIGFRTLGAITGGASTVGKIDNFVITPAQLGSWQSASTSISSLTTTDGSQIAWLESLASGGLSNTAIMQTSIDAGTSWQLCTNGGTIPGLTKGVSVSGLSLLVKITLYSTTVAGSPIIGGLNWRVMGAFPTVTGTRDTAPLGNDTMVRSNVVGGWGTAFDGQAYTKTGTGTINLTSNEATIANTTGDVHMALGSRTAADSDGTVRLSLSISTIAAGLELRFGSSTSYYRLSMSTTALTLSKDVSGVSTALATTSQTQTASTFYRMRLRIAGTSLQGRVWADGTLEPTAWQVTATDSALTSGGFALYANGTGTASFDHLRVTQYPDPSLSLASVLPRLGSTLSSWIATIPNNTTLAVKTSLDGVNWSSATNGGSITGLNAQPAPTIDTFTSNTSANYTSTNKTGGSTASASFDTTNRRLTLSGGSGALYLHAGVTATDVDVLCDMDESDAGGLVWRYIDQSNYYELGAYDDSASGGFTNQLRLYKVASNVRSLLGTASTISWPRSTVGASPYRRIRVTMLGSLITVYLDGTQMQTYTDGAPLGAGLCGLRNDGGTSRYYQLRIQPQGDYVSGTPSGDVVTGDFVYTQATLTTSDPSVTPQQTDLNTSARSPQLATGVQIPAFHDPATPFVEFLNTEMDNLALASGDYTWNLATNGALSFAERHATPAPWCLSSSDLKYSGNGQGSLSGAQVTPMGTADLYRNRQNITNCTGLVSPPPETKIADGTVTSWQMAYPLYSAPTITVSGVTQTVGIQGVDTGKQFYWQAKSNSIGQDTSALKIPSGTILTFSYVGQFVQTVTRDNLPEQAARAAIEGNSGIVEATEDGKGMLSTNATTYADGLLARFGVNNAVQLTGTTARSGLASGMIVPVFLPEHQLINHQMLITNVATTAQQQGDGSTLYFYTVTATEGANLSNWVKIFKFS